MSTSRQVDPEMQSESRPREDCNPKRDVGMRNCSTAPPIGRADKSGGSFIENPCADTR
jgi:hypothetical protein